MVNKKSSNPIHSTPRGIRPGTREQEFKNAPTAQRVNEQFVLRNLSFSESINVAEALFFCLTYYVTPAVHSFLCRRRLVSRTATNYDFADMMQVISYNNNNDKNFLHFPVSSKIISKSISARNELCHLNLEAVKQNWPRNLSVWTKLCRSVDDEHGASNVQLVYDRLINGQYKHAIEEKPFFNIIGVYDENSALGLSFVLYSCLARYVGPSLRRFLILKKGHSASTDFDVYLNLKYTAEELRHDANFLAKGASKRADKELVRVALEGRNHVCHGKFTEVFYKWNMYLQSWRHVRQIRPARMLFPIQYSSVRQRNN
ncbi:hypothetical protein GHT06_012264 [Daphnia sinensis]|uniref:Uncharacterized protein n=1 Tax=Daphnia sinensis TaxID=1820382 RepID=A0AAD5LFJ5_9CRUS|nr:hypothetical protein GHT06_012264 [Daphnia sinensis]